MDTRWTCARHSLDMLQVWFRHALEMFQTCFEHVSNMLWTWFGHDWHVRKYVGCGRWQLIQGSQCGTISRSCIKINKESSRSKFLAEGRRLILRSKSGMMGAGWLTPPIPNIIGFLLSQTKTWETTVLDVVNFSLLSAPSKPWLTLVVCPQVVFA